MGKRPRSPGDAGYLLIVDDYSRFAWPYLYKKKSDVPSAFASFPTDIRAQGIPSTVECLRSDNGTEFTKQNFVALLG